MGPRGSRAQPCGLGNIRTGASCSQGRPSASVPSGSVLSLHRCRGPSCPLETGECSSVLRDQRGNTEGDAASSPVGGERLLSVLVERRGASASRSAAGRGFQTASPPETPPSRTEWGGAPALGPSLMDNLVLSGSAGSFRSKSSRRQWPGEDWVVAIGAVSISSCRGPSWTAIRIFAISWGYGCIEGSFRFSLFITFWECVRKPFVRTFHSKMYYCCLISLPQS